MYDSYIFSHFFYFLLFSQLTQLGDLGKKTIKELGLGLKTVISVDLHAPALKAFQLMAEQRITGVAVNEEDGTLFTIISAKDIKEVELKPPFKSLFLSATQFVAQVRSHQLKESIPIGNFIVFLLFSYIFY